MVPVNPADLKRPAPVGNIYHRDRLAQCGEKSYHKPMTPENQLSKKLGIGAVIAAGFAVFQIAGSQPGLFTDDVPGAAVSPVVQTGNPYLETMREQYFAQHYTDAELMTEGRKVCDAHLPQESLLRMVQADMGVSLTGAAVLVGAAQGGLGC